MMMMMINNQTEKYVLQHITKYNSIKVYILYLIINRFFEIVFLVFFFYNGIKWDLVIINYY